MGKNMIVGSDWWTDCDDAVAMRLFVRAHKAGKINLLGVNIDACAQESVPSLDAFLTAEGMPGMPIGIDLAATDEKVKLTYQKRLAAMEGPLRSNEEALNGVSLYRKLIAEADGPVDIAEIGFEQVLADLLDSQPDEYSPLTGRELIDENVGTLWLMAGKWDEEGGKEYNIACSARSCTAAAHICECWPSRIVYLGFEVGVSVITGDELDAGDMLKTAMVDWGTDKGRSSWDPMLAELSIMDDISSAGYDLVCGYASVDAADGSNFFRRDEKGPHGYVVKKLSDGEYAARINAKIR